MGLLELILALLGCAVSGAALVVWLLRAWKRERAELPPRAPLPTLPLVVALLSVLVAPFVGFGLAVVVLERGLAQSLGSTVLSGRYDPLAAQLWTVVPLALWLALPGVLAALRLLLSRDRSWLAALVLGLCAWVGGGLGLALGFGVVVPAVMTTLTTGMGEIDTAVHLVTAVRSAVATLAALVIAGAIVPSVAVLAGASRRALLRTLQATVLMPAGALTIAAVCTPPDLLSQLILAFLLGACWLTGLGAGAAVALLRGRGAEAS